MHPHPVGKAAPESMMEVALQSERGARGVDGESVQALRGGWVVFCVPLALLEAPCTPILGSD